MATSPDPPPLHDVPGMLAGQPGRLPMWPTPLVGRERDLARLLALARQPGASLVTITGPGGAGKTRLAVEAARELAADHTDGAVFVPLSPVRDSTFVPTAVARALALADPDRLSEALAERDLLLVIDNLEHVLDAVPILVDLVRGAPSVRVLATSRVRLNVSGEIVYPAPPLGPNAAVALYEMRARAHSSSYVITAEMAPVVEEMCARLDGLPLAIELAAARSKVITPRELLALLPSHLDILGEGPRDAPARQRTLRNTIEWSYDLLDERGRAALRRLAVFSAGFSFDGAEAVIGPDEALGVLASLVDSSLLRSVEGPGGTSRFLMLETIREYALERLLASGEEMAIRERHARYYLDLVASLESSAQANTTPVTQTRVRRLHPELDNLRVALAWLLEHDPLAAARLASGLDEFWFRYGYFREGRLWLGRVLKRIPDMPTEVRRRVVDTGGWLSYQQGDLAEAEALLTEAVSLHRAIGDSMSHAWALGRLADVALSQWEPERARDLLEEARQIGHAIGNPLIETAALSDLGRVLLISGDAAAAEATLRKALRQQQAMPGTIGAAVSTLFLGSALLAGGKTREAAAAYGEALAVFVAAEDQANVARCVEGVARAVVATNPATAARLFGAAAAMRERLGHPVDREDQTAVALAVDRARQRLSQGAFAATWSEGQVLSWKDVAREAMTISAGNATAGAGDGDVGLSAREREVLKLLVAGMTDVDIGDALFISRRTVATHVRHIYEKLGVASRAEAAATAIRRGLV